MTSKPEGRKAVVRLTSDMAGEIEGYFRYEGTLPHPSNISDLLDALRSIASGQMRVVPVEFVAKFNKLTNYIGLAACHGYKCRLPHCQSCNDESESRREEQVMWDLLHECTAMLAVPYDHKLHSRRKLK